MEIPLSRVPELFFDRELWTLFISYFDSSEIALERIGFPPGPTGYHHESKVSEITQSRWSEIEEASALGRQVLLCLQSKFLKEELTSTGIPRGFWRPVREITPPSHWRRLWPNFIGNWAMSTLESYDEVIVSWSPEDKNVELLERLEEFLSDQKRQGQDARKTLTSAAEEYFGQSIPIRVFNEGYSRVFQKSRGRPSSKRK
jgi:hypothetical protein